MLNNSDLLEGLQFLSYQILTIIKYWMDLSQDF